MKKEIEKIVGEAFGEVSALFMRSEKKGVEMVMPGKSLQRILNRTVNKIDVLQNPIGEVIHFFDKAMVMVIKVNDTIKIGDKIKVVRKDTEFEQIIESMEVEHKTVESAKKNTEVAIKITESTKIGARIYRAK